MSNSTRTKTVPSFTEFVIIVSLMMALTALSIDAMLPALPQIGTDLQVQSTNNRQLVISAIFMGLAVGQLIFGPLSDKTGRKPAIYAGLLLYAGGSLVCVAALSFPMMLAGRLLQGAGVSAPRAVGLALVRDLYEGRDMARVMSFVMTVFILVPMVAPLMGQAILLFTGWRAIFGVFILLALTTLIWFGLRIPETLAPADRAPFSLRRIVRATITIIKIRPALGYTIIAGFIMGAHLGYLNSSQQIFQEQYALGELFPIFFAVNALAIGMASLSNTRLVMRFGMRLLVRTALWTSIALSGVMLVIAFLSEGQPSLVVLMVYTMATLFCVGILFGNNNALAMEPLGKVAGIGAAIVGSLSTLVSIPLGTMVGQSYNGTVIPLVAGFGILAVFSLLVFYWIESGAK